MPTNRPRRRRRLPGDSSLADIIGDVSQFVTSTPDSQPGWTRTIPATLSPPSRSEGAAMDASDIGISTSSRRGRRGGATPAASVTPSIVVLGPHDSLVGTLTVDGNVRIEGTLDGEVSATGEVNVHSSGTARAQISARDIVINGAAEGRAAA